MKYDIWFVFLHDGTNAVRIADRSDQNFQIQAVAVFSAKLLLDFVGIVLIHVKDDQFLWMRCCDLSAELASDGASASCHQQGFGDDLPDSINLYDKSNVLKKNIDPSTYKFLSPVMDITFDSVTPTADDPVRVTFVANNMTDNIQVDILYYCPEHGWEVLQGEKISDNQVAAYFHAGSSVMALIYREKGATVGTSQVSPQTGARSTWPIAVSAIFFVSFGIFALYKSKKA